MNTTTVVVYTSTYGASERYAHHIAHALDCSLVTIDDYQPGSYDTLVVVSPNYAGIIEGVSFVKKHGRDFATIAVATVGMSPVDEMERTDPVAPQVNPHVNGVIRCFYLPGSLIFSQLSKTHQVGLKAVAAMLKLKKNRSRAEQNLLDTYDKDLDLVDFDACQGLIDWVSADPAEK